MKVEVIVRLKEGVLDPQGKAIHHALDSLGYKEVQSVSTGKIITLEVKGDNPKTIQKQVNAMCETLLANLVIEDYQIKI